MTILKRSQYLCLQHLNKKPKTYAQGKEKSFNAKNTCCQ